MSIKQFLVGLAVYAAVVVITLFIGTVVTSSFDCAIKEFSLQQHWTCEL